MKNMKEPKNNDIAERISNALDLMYNQEKNDIDRFIEISETLNKKKENKIKKTFTIDKQVFEDFRTISQKMSISKSAYVENKIKEFNEINREHLI